MPELLMTQSQDMVLSARFESVAPRAAMLAELIVKETRAHVDQLVAEKNAHVEAYARGAHKRRIADLKELWPAEIAERDGPRLHRHGWTQMEPFEWLETIQEAVSRPTSRLRSLLDMSPATDADETQVGAVFGKDERMQLADDEVRQHLRAHIDRIVHAERREHYWALRHAEYRAVTESDLPQIRRLYERSVPTADQLSLLLKAASEPANRHARAAARIAQAQLSGNGFLMERFTDRMADEGSFEDDFRAAARGDERYFARCIADHDTGRVFGALLLEHGNEERMGAFMRRGSVGGVMLYDSPDEETRLTSPAMLRGLVRGSLLVNDTTDPATRYVPYRLMARSLSEVSGLAGKGEKGAEPHLAVEVHEGVTVQPIHVHIDLANRAARRLYASIGLEAKGESDNRDQPSTTRKIDGHRYRLHSRYALMAAPLERVTCLMANQWNATRAAFGDYSEEI